MKIINMQYEPYVEYSLNNNIITFHGENELSIDLSARQKSSELIIDIVLDAGLLKESVSKTSNKIKMVASIVIPPVELYSAPYNVSNCEGQYKPQLKRDINLDLVKLKLWNYKLTNIKLV